MVLLHHPHTPIRLRPDQWAEEVLSRAPRSAREGCFIMQMVRQGYFQRTGRIVRGQTLMQSHRTVNCGGESSFRRPPRPPLPRHRAAEAVWPEDHASTITPATQPSRDTTVTTATTTTSLPAHSTLTHPRTCRHHTPLTASPLTKDESGGKGSAAPRGL